VALADPIAYSGEPEADDPDERRLQLTWKETGGPPVTAPERNGFASLLIKSTGEGQTRIDYQPEGVRCFDRSHALARSGQLPKLLICADFRRGASMAERDRSPRRWAGQKLTV
jgi:hypothetical protein